MKQSKELQAAIRAARKAAKYLLKYYDSRQGIIVDKKGGVEQVTKYDKGSEKIIINELKKFNYNIISEEIGKINKNSEFTWLIDPIDGTVNFIHRYPYFSVSIGLAKKDDIFLGVVYNPVYDELFTAIKGKGAFLNGKRIRVSNIENLEESGLTTGFAYFKGKEFDRLLKIFGKVKHNVEMMRQGGSSAIDLCYVASGRLEGFFEKGAHIYDIAAGKIVLEEAGGKISMMDGKKIKMDLNSTCATNGKIHNDLLRLIK